MTVELSFFCQFTVNFYSIWCKNHCLWGDNDSRAFILCVFDCRADFFFFFFPSHYPKFKPLPNVSKTQSATQFSVKRTNQTVTIEMTLSCFLAVRNFITASPLQRTSYHTLRRHRLYSWLCIFIKPKKRIVRKPITTCCSAYHTTRRGDIKNVTISYNGYVGPWWNFWKSQFAAQLTVHND